MLKGKWLHHMDEKYNYKDIAPQLARVGPNDSALAASPSLQHAAEDSPLRTLHCVNFSLPSVHQSILKCTLKRPFCSLNMIVKVLLKRKVNFDSNFMI